MPDKPNIVYFHVDNLGYGELGCYGGGPYHCIPEPPCCVLCKQFDKRNLLAPGA